MHVIIVWVKERIFLLSFRTKTMKLKHCHTGAVWSTLNKVCLVWAGVNGLLSTSRHEPCMGTLVGFISCLKIPLLKHDERTFVFVVNKPAENLSF